MSTDNETQFSFPILVKGLDLKKISRNEELQTMVYTKDGDCKEMIGEE